MLYLQLVHRSYSFSVGILVVPIGGLLPPFATAGVALKLISTKDRHRVIITMNFEIFFIHFTPFAFTL